MSSLDRIVSRARRALEDLLPWYDREAERRAELHTEAVRQRSIKARIRAEAIIAQHRIER